MMTTTEELDNIKVEIALGDLIELRELAGYYKKAAEERAQYAVEISTLRHEIEALKKQFGIEKTEAN